VMHTRRGQRPVTAKCIVSALCVGMWCSRCTHMLHTQAGTSKGSAGYKMPPALRITQAGCRLLHGVHHPWVLHALCVPLIRPGPAVQMQVTAQRHPTPLSNGFGQAWGGVGKVCVGMWGRGSGPAQRTVQGRKVSAHRSATMNRLWQREQRSHACEMKTRACLPAAKQGGYSPTNMPALPRNGGQRHAHAPSTTIARLLQHHSLQLTADQHSVCLSGRRGGCMHAWGGVGWGGVRGPHGHRQVGCYSLSWSKAR
jgi:hypothetical protein